MEITTYYLAIEDPDGDTVSGQTYPTEAEARREAEHILRDPIYADCRVWLTYPEGRTLELSPASVGRSERASRDGTAPRP